MKKLRVIIFFVAVGLFFPMIYTQQTSNILHGNSVSAFLQDEGDFFSKPHGFPIYKIDESGNQLISHSSLWFGGTNQDGDLKLVASLSGKGREFYRGPYSSTGQYLDTAYLYNYESGIWTVSKQEIIYHIDNYNQPGYVAPHAIAKWPGNGDSNIGVTQQLAPFVDVNNNGIYEPHLGDYPCIKGDMASYIIMNEDRSHGNSGGEKIGAEFHLMFYHIKSSNYIDSTTFIDITVINRGNNSFEDFKMAMFMRPSIGNPIDDYIGCLSSKNLAYAYNSTNYDEPGGDMPGFGNNPPAVGIVSLNNEFDYFGYFRNNGGKSSEPTLPKEYWNYMNGKWLDETEWTYGGTGLLEGSPTRYIYDGNPYLDTGWTELKTHTGGVTTGVGRKSLFFSTNGESFHPGDTVSYHYAIIVNREGDYLENVQGLINYADSVKQYFDNHIFSCEQQGTGVVDDFELEVQNIRHYFEIVRLDGEGNMGRSVTLHPDTEQKILAQNSTNEIRYKRGQGPIEVQLTDSVDFATGHFILKFDEYTNNNVNTANWTIYRYDTIGGDLLEKVHSTSAIDIGNEQLIPQWKMVVKVKQEKYICTWDSYGNNCQEKDKIAIPLEAELAFEDESNKWLTGVRSTSENTPLNWVKSGFSPNVYWNSSEPDDDIHNINCYSNTPDYDINGLFAKLAGGIIAPSVVTRFNSCEFSPIVSSPIFGNSSSVLGNLSVFFWPTVYHPSIEIVFTSDTSKWSRSPVIELNAFDISSVNGGKAGFLRQSSSVDKLGNPDGTGMGMGWFPGYAIDVETGRRLNIAFGENSTLTDDNGDDMIWNPTDRIFDNDGNYVLGGQHVIYVFGGEKEGMPNYDGGAYIHQLLSQETIESFQKVYTDLSWVMQPLLASGATLNSTEARLKMRINKEFKNRVLTNQNEGRPMFSWDAVPFHQVTGVTAEELVESKLNIFPNPATNQVKVVWKNLQVKNINILSFDGKIVKNIAVNQNNGENTINIQNLSSGVYFVKVGSEMRKLVVQ